MNLWKYYDGDLKYPNLFNHSHEIEIAKSNPKWAFDYALKHGKNEELEPVIAKSSTYSFDYANDILNGPFPLGEPAIAKNKLYSLDYANDILNGPFPLGEPAIAKDEYYSERYTQYILKKDFYLNGKLICKYEE